jgi:hypothetical protein
MPLTIDYKYNIIKHYIDKGGVHMANQERHHKIDLLRELAKICKQEKVEIASKAIIDKHNILGECVSYSRYLQAFGDKEKLDQALREYRKLPDAQYKLALF